MRSFHEIKAGDIEEYVDSLLKMVLQRYTVSDLGEIEITVQLLESSTLSSHRVIQFNGKWEIENSHPKGRRSIPYWRRSEHLAETGPQSSLDERVAPGLDDVLLLLSAVIWLGEPIKTTNGAPYAEIGYSDDGNLCEFEFPEPLPVS